MKRKLDLPVNPFVDRVSNCFIFTCDLPMTFIFTLYNKISYLHELISQIILQSTLLFLYVSYKCNTWGRGFGLNANDVEVISADSPCEIVEVTGDSITCDVGPCATEDCFREEGHYFQVRRTRDDPVSNENTFILISQHTFWSMRAYIRRKSKWSLDRTNAIRTLIYINL